MEDKDDEETTGGSKNRGENKKKGKGKRKGKGKDKEDKDDTGLEDEGKGKGTKKEKAKKKKGDVGEGATARDEIKATKRAKADRKRKARRDSGESAGDASGDFGANDKTLRRASKKSRETLDAGQSCFKTLNTFTDMSFSRNTRTHPSFREEVHLHSGSSPPSNQHFCDHYESRDATRAGCSLRFQQ
jgi:hypothetical protein